LLAHTPLSRPPHYKKEEIQKVMKLLAGTGNVHFEAADETTLRLVDRVAKVKWLLEDANSAGEIARRSLGISLSPTDTASNISVVDVAEVTEKPGVQTRSRKAEGEAEFDMSPTEAKTRETKQPVPTTNRPKKVPPEVPKHRYGNPCVPPVQHINGNGSPPKKIPPKAPPPRRRGRFKAVSSAAEETSPVS
jgi:hypothetical protein